MAGRSRAGWSEIRAQFEPGGKARLDVSVLDQKGAPVRVALGLSAVDEAFFALSDVRPDLETHFFTIETELRHVGSFDSAQHQLVDPHSPELIAGADPKLDDARRALLGMLAERLGGSPSSALEWRPVRLELHLDYTRDRLAALAAWWPMLLGSLLLAVFVGYALLRTARPAPPGVRDFYAWTGAHRALGLSWVLGLFCPPAVGLVAEIMTDSLDERLEQRIVFAAWATAALVFAVWQYRAVRRLRAEPEAAGVPGYAFALGLLPAGAFAAQVGLAADLAFDLDIGDDLFGRMNLELFVGLAVILFYQLGFGGLSVIQHGAAERLPVRSRLWLLFSRSFVVGAPLTLVLLGALAHEAAGSWKVSVRDAIERQEEPRYTRSGAQEGSMGTRAKGEEGAMGAPPRYAVRGPRPNMEVVGREPRVHVRSRFPETLLWLPELVTDAQGKASLEVPLADSITTYRVALSAVAADGSLGSFTLPLRTYQDFFVDVALPATLTQGDEVAVPVTVHNYLDRTERVTLRAEGEGWESPDGAERVLELGPRAVVGLRWRLRAVMPGDRALRITARGSQSADAVERRLRVEPRGFPIVTTRNGRLRGTAREELVFPAEAVAGANELYVKVYGGLFSQLVEALDGGFQRPYGCFEQTSSTTYPNVLLLALLRKGGAASPEVEQKALAYIEEGYQRLLTFEAGGGGFGWHEGQAPQVQLSAYALQEFSDMGRVFPVDPGVLERTKQWLYAQQRGDGSFTTLPASATAERRERDVARTTAFVARALVEAGARDARLERALDFVARGAGPDDPTTLALRALALLSAGKREQGRALVERLLPLAQRSDGDVYWATREETYWYSRGDANQVELTALVAQALGLLGEHGDLHRAALDFLSKSRSRFGVWPSTAATVAALRALLPAVRRVDGERQLVRFRVGETAAGELAIEKGQRDVHALHGLSRFAAAGNQVVELASPSLGELNYQLVATHYLPFDEGSFGENGPLRLDVRYLTRRVPVGGAIDVDVEVRWSRAEPATMGLVELAVPPGFEAETEGLVQLAQSQKISSFSASPSRVSVYVPEFTSAAPLRLRYRLRALYPVRALAPSAAAYPYYESELRAESKPVVLTVEDAR